MDEGSRRPASVQSGGPLHLDGRREPQVADLGAHLYVPTDPPHHNKGAVSPASPQGVAHAEDVLDAHRFAA
ncbi:MAG: hypothetical protein QXP98_02595 [Thermoproteus sp.]